MRKKLRYRERLVRDFADKGIETVDNLFLGKIGYIKHVTLHGVRHSYCSVQVNHNTKLSASEVTTII